MSQNRQQKKWAVASLDLPCEAQIEGAGLDQGLVGGVGGGGDLSTEF